MPEWNRNTLWRQGDCLGTASAQTLGLTNLEAPEETAVIVVSHDCDIAQASVVEPAVEVIVGRYVSELRGDFTSAKNLRKLHLPCTRGGVASVVELTANSKKSILKDGEGPLILAGHEPEKNFQLASQDKTVLQAWLAARYRRAAFSDEFDRRLKEQTKLAEKIAKALKDTGSHIHAVFFDVDGGEELQREGINDLYELTIIILYRTDEDPDLAEKAAITAKDKIIKAISDKCHNKSEDTWQWIELVDVEVVSDQALTYALSQNLKKWQIDHISFRADPPQNTLRD